MGQNFSVSEALLKVNCSLDLFIVSSLVRSCMLIAFIKILSVGLQYCLFHPGSFYARSFPPTGLCNFEYKPFLLICSTVSSMKDFFVLGTVLLDLDRFDLQSIAQAVVENMVMTDQLKQENSSKVLTALLLQHRHQHQQQQQQQSSGIMRRLSSKKRRKIVVSSDNIGYNGESEGIGNGGLKTDGSKDMKVCVKSHDNYFVLINNGNVLMVKGGE